MFFKKKEIGYLIYLVLILLVKLMGEIKSDGLDSNDFSGIIL